MARKKKIVPASAAARAEDIKKYRITYSIPGVNAQLSFDTTDTDETIVRERFSRLFKGLNIISVEEVK